jgi:hypothetical protein
MAAAIWIPIGCVVLAAALGELIYMAVRHGIPALRRRLRRHG